jgi:hypothetical protein
MTTKAMLFELMITFTQHLRFSPILSEVRTINVRVTRVGVELMITFTQHLRFFPIFSQVHVAEYFMLCCVDHCSSVCPLKIVLSVLPLTAFNYPSVL